MGTLGTQMRVRHLLRVWADHQSRSDLSAVPVRLLRLLRDIRAGWEREARGVAPEIDVMVCRSLDAMQQAMESVGRPGADRERLSARLEEIGQSLLRSLERLEQSSAQLARSA